MKRRHWTTWIAVIVIVGCTKAALKEPDPAPTVDSVSGAAKEIDKKANELDEQIPVDEAYKGDSQELVTLTGEDALSAARDMIQSAEADRKQPSDRSRLVDYIVASTLLYRYV